MRAGKPARRPITRARSARAVLSTAAKGKAAQDVIPKASVDVPKNTKRSTRAAPKNRKLTKQVETENSKQNVQEVSEKAKESVYAEPKKDKGDSQVAVVKKTSEIEQAEPKGEKENVQVAEAPVKDTKESLLPSPKKGEENMSEAPKIAKESVRATSEKAEENIQAAPRIQEWLDVVKEDAKQADLSLMSPDEMEDALRLFDLNPRFGPFTGIGRLVRWDRAQRWGLQPPLLIRRIVECGKVIRNQHSDLL